VCLALERFVIEKLIRQEIPGAALQKLIDT
jgi:hypothetical protein